MSFSSAELLKVLDLSTKAALPADFERCSSLAYAEAGSLSFHIGMDATGQVRTTKASAVLVPRGFAGSLPEGVAALQMEDPYAAIILVMERLVVPRIVHPRAKIHPTASIHPKAVVEGAVGEGTVVGPNVWISAGSTVGADCKIDAGVCIHSGVTIGDSCNLLAGCVLGGRGFGFRGRNSERQRVPHFGGVVIGRGCEIGVNSVVAAGFLEPTLLGDDVHLDSLVQIGHNCKMGNRIFMAAQSGLAGSVVVEDDVEMGGGAQVAGHLLIGQGCRIAAKSGVTRSIPAGQTVAGFPAVAITQWRKMVVRSRRLDS